MKFVVQPTCGKLRILLVTEVSVNEQSLTRQIQGKLANRCWSPHAAFRSTKNGHSCLLLATIQTFQAVRFFSFCTEGTFLFHHFSRQNRTQL